MNEMRRHRIKERALNTTDKTTTNNNNNTTDLYKRSKTFAAPHAHATKTIQPQQPQLQQQQIDIDSPQMRYKRSNSAGEALIRSKLSAASFSVKQIPVDDDDSITTSPITTPTNKESSSDEELSITTASARIMRKFENHRLRSQSLVPSAEILYKVSINNTHDAFWDF